MVTGQNQWTDEEFFRSGQITLEEEILNDLTNICQGKDPKQMRVLEIGCGAGRVTRAFAGFFGEVYAVDISREMVRQASAAVAGFPNAHVFQNNGKDLSAVRRSGGTVRTRRALEFDFAFSFIVFQHIPSREIIENYVREVHRLAAPRRAVQIPGARVPDVQTEHVRQLGREFLSPSRRPARWRNAADLKCATNTAPGDQYYWLWFFKK